MVLIGVAGTDQSEVSYDFSDWAGGSGLWRCCGVVLGSGSLDSSSISLTTVYDKYFTRRKGIRITQHGHDRVK